MTTRNPKPNAQNSWPRAILAVGTEFFFNMFGGIIVIPPIFLSLAAVVSINRIPWLAATLALALIGIMIFAIYRFMRNLRRNKRGG